MSDIILETIGLVHTYPGGTTALKGVDPQASTEEMVRYALRAMVMKG